MFHRERAVTTQRSCLSTAWRPWWWRRVFPETTLTFSTRIPRVSASRPTSTCPAPCPVSRCPSAACIRQQTRTRIRTALSGPTAAACGTAPRTTSRARHAPGASNARTVRRRSILWISLLVVDYRVVVCTIYNRHWAFDQLQFYVLVFDIVLAEFNAVVKLYFNKCQWVTGPVKKLS